MSLFKPSSHHLNPEPELSSLLKDISSEFPDKAELSRYRRYNRFLLQEEHEKYSPPNLALNKSGINDDDENPTKSIKLDPTTSTVKDDVKDELNRKINLLLKNQDLTLKDALLENPDEIGESLDVRTIWLENDSELCHLCTTLIVIKDQIRKGVLVDLYGKLIVPNLLKSDKLSRNSHASLMELKTNSEFSFNNYLLKPLLSSDLIRNSSQLYEFLSLAVKSNATPVIRELLLTYLSQPSDRVIQESDIAFLESSFLFDKNVLTDDNDVAVSHLLNVLLRNSPENAKNTKFGKLYVNVFKKLPTTLNSSLYGLCQKLKHESFLKKSMENELKKRTVI